jgi:hypothetical protein
VLCRIVSFLKLAGISSLLLVEAASEYPPWSILLVLFWHYVESCCKRAIACLGEVLPLNDMVVLLSQGSSACCCSAALLGLCLSGWGSLPMSRLYAPLLYIVLFWVFCRSASAAIGFYPGLLWHLFPLYFPLYCCYGSRQLGWGSLPICLGFLLCTLSLLC